MVEGGPGRSRQGRDRPELYQAGKDPRLGVPFFPAAAMHVSYIPKYQKAP